MVAIDNTRALSPRLTYTIVTYVTDILLSFHKARQTRETVRQLSRLTDRELNDIGLSRGDVLHLARAGQL